MKTYEKSCTGWGAGWLEGGARRHRPGGLAEKGELPLRAPTSAPAGGRCRPRRPAWVPAHCPAQTTFLWPVHGRRERGRPRKGSDANDTGPGGGGPIVHKSQAAPYCWGFGVQPAGVPGGAGIYRVSAAGAAPIPPGFGVPARTRACRRWGRRAARGVCARTRSPDKGRVALQPIRPPPATLSRWAGARRRRLPTSSGPPKRGGPWDARGARAFARWGRRQGGHP